MKTKPFGVRFDQELFDIVKSIDDQATYQSALSKYEEAFKSYHNISTVKPAFGSLSGNFPNIQIYGLLNPINQSYFYVGRTSFPLNRRLSVHMSEVKLLGKTGEKLNLRKLKIISEIIEQGLKPEIVLLETVIPQSEDEFRGFHPKEYYWIAELLSKEHPITNKGVKTIAIKATRPEREDGEEWYEFQQRLQTWKKENGR